MAIPISNIFVIGGTGAQGIPIVRGLVSDGTYVVKVLTRDPSSRRAKMLLGLGPRIELLKGDLTSESDLRVGLQGCDSIFVNIDGFTVGEKAEMFWTMRIYELAVESRVRFFVLGNLDYSYKQSGYDPRYRVGHYDAKGRMAEWILRQHDTNKCKPFYHMKIALFTTGPYIEMATASWTPMAPQIEKDDKGEKVVTWRLPLTETGAVVHVALEDCAYYVRWLFDHPERADGMNLAVAIEHIHYTELATAFERVTGHKARFIDATFEEYWSTGALSSRAMFPTGWQSAGHEPGTMTVRENFTGWWNIWRASGGNKGLVKRDYDLLDEIHPGRIRSVEDYFRLEEERARKDGTPTLLERVVNAEVVLKLHEDSKLRSPGV